jgi:ABC-type bacteriocin/lantibiotic exporter with double-glycine peptidase domain
VNGRSLLVLGPSGSGKSTLLKVLLEKFFPDYQGPLCHGRYLEKVSLVAGASRLCLFTGWNFKEEFETDC